jgi:hypothetical protein
VNNVLKKERRRNSGIKRRTENTAEQLMDLGNGMITNEKENQLLT